MSRIGDFSNKRLVHRFYKNGYTSRNPKYVTAGQYSGATFVGSGDMGITGNYSYTGGSTMNIHGSAGSNGGSATGKLTMERPVQLEGFIATFNHSFVAQNLGYVNNYNIEFFGVRIERDVTNSKLNVYRDNILLLQNTYSSIYTHFMLEEDGGEIKISHSTNGTTWTHLVTTDVSVKESSLSLFADIGATGTTLATGASLLDLEIWDRNGNFLGFDSNTIGEFTLSRQINMTGMSASLTLPYSPMDVTREDSEYSYIKVGNYIESYSFAEDLGGIEYVPILDHNGDEILDDTSFQIYGGTNTAIPPEEKDITLFMGYIEAINYDFSKETVTLSLISHGEQLSNMLVTSGNKVDITAIPQLTQNATVSVNNSRQTFTPQSNLKVSGIRLRVSSSSGDGVSVSIGVGATTLAQSNTITWNGSLSETVLDFKFNDVILEANKVYWFGINSVGTTSWSYQNTDVYDGGTRQNLSGGVWSNVVGDVYFEIYSRNEETVFTYSGSINGLVDKVFTNIQQSYIPLLKGTVDNPSYTISTNASVDTGKSMIEAILGLSPTGYWFDISSNGTYSLKEFPTVTEHIFVLGRDFTEFTLDESLAEIVNDVLFIGADIGDNKGKLALRTADKNSIFAYKRGLSIESNGNVSRYDSAQLLSTSALRTSPIWTTSLTIPATLYNIETINIGDLVKVVNANNDTLAEGLQVSRIDYTPASITMSLDSAPVTINATVDKLRRDLNNTSTSGVSSVL